MTEGEALDYLLQHRGKVPCSRYGGDTDSCAPTAVACAVILAAETGEPMTTETVDHLMSLVVNDHDDPAYLMATYGPEYGYVPGQFQGCHD